MATTSIPNSDVPFGEMGEDDELALMEARNHRLLAMLRQMRAKQLTRKQIKHDSLLAPGPASASNSDCASVDSSAGLVDYVNSSLVPEAADPEGARSASGSGSRSVSGSISGCGSRASCSSDTDNDSNNNEGGHRKSKHNHSRKRSQLKAAQTLDQLIEEMEHSLADIVKNTGVHGVVADSPDNDGDGGGMHDRARSTSANNRNSKVNGDGINSKDVDSTTGTTIGRSNTTTDSDGTKNKLDHSSSASWTRKTSSKSVVANYTTSSNAATATTDAPGHTATLPSTASDTNSKNDKDIFSPSIRRVAFGRSEQTDVPTKNTADNKVDSGHPAKSASIQLATITIPPIEPIAIPTPTMFGSDTQMITATNYSSIMSHWVLNLDDIHPISLFGFFVKSKHKSNPSSSSANVASNRSISSIVGHVKGNTTTDEGVSALGTGTGSTGQSGSGVTYNNNEQNDDIHPPATTATTADASGDIVIPAKESTFELSSLFSSEFFRSVRRHPLSIGLGHSLQAYLNPHGSQNTAASKTMPIFRYRTTNADAEDIGVLSKNWLEGPRYIKDAIIANIFVFEVIAAWLVMTISYLVSPPSWRIRVEWVFSILSSMFFLASCARQSLISSGFCITLLFFLVYIFDSYFAAVVYNRDILVLFANAFAYGHLFVIMDTYRESLIIALWLAFISLDYMVKSTVPETTGEYICAVYCVSYGVLTVLRDVLYLLADYQTKRSVYVNPIDGEVVSFDESYYPIYEKVVVDWSGPSPTIPRLRSGINVPFGTVGLKLPFVVTRYAHIFYGQSYYYSNFESTQSRFGLSVIGIASRSVSCAWRLPHSLVLTLDAVLSYEMELAATQQSAISSSSSSVRLNTHKQGKVHRFPSSHGSQLHLPNRRNQAKQGAVQRRGVTSSTPNSPLPEFSAERRVYTSHLQKIRQESLDKLHETPPTFCIEALQSKAISCVLSSSKNTANTLHLPIVHPKSRGVSVSVSDVTLTVNGSPWYSASVSMRDGQITVLDLDPDTTYDIQVAILGFSSAPICVKTFSTSESSGYGSKRLGSFESTSSSRSSVCDKVANGGRSGAPLVSSIPAMSSTTPSTLTPWLVSSLQTFASVSSKHKQVPKINQYNRHQQQHQSSHLSKHVPVALHAHSLVTPMSNYPNAALAASPDGIETEMASLKPGDGFSESPHDLTEPTMGRSIDIASNDRDRALLSMAQHQYQHHAVLPAATIEPAAGGELVASQDDRGGAFGNTSPHSGNGQGTIDDDSDDEDDEDEEDDDIDPIDSSMGIQTQPQHHAQVSGLVMSPEEGPGPSELMTSVALRVKQHIKPDGTSNDSCPLTTSELSQAIAQERMAKKSTQFALRRLKRDSARQLGLLRTDIQALVETIDRESAAVARSRSRIAFLAEQIRQSEAYTIEAKKQIKDLRISSELAKKELENAKQNAASLRGALRRMERSINKTASGQEKTLRELRDTRENLRMQLEQIQQMSDRLEVERVRLSAATSGEYEERKRIATERRDAALNTANASERHRLDALREQQRDVDGYEEACSILRAQNEALNMTIEEERRFKEKLQQELDRLVSSKTGS